MAIELRLISQIGLCYKYLLREEKFFKNILALQL
jgi:hypothetical protein